MLVVTAAISLEEQKESLEADWLLQLFPPDWSKVGMRSDPRSAALESAMVVGAKAMVVVDGFEGEVRIAAWLESGAEGQRAL